MDDGAPVRIQLVRWPWVVAGAALLLATAVVWSGLGGEATSIAVADVAAVLAAFGGAAVVLRAARHNPADRVPWTLFACAMGLWGLGEVLWRWYEVVLGDEVPFPSVADVAYLAAVPFAVAGLLGFARRSGGSFAVRTVLDGCLVATAMLFVAWALVLGPAWHADAGGTWAQVISVSYPATDLVLAVLALLVLLWGRSEQRAGLRTMAAGLLVMAAADVAFTWLTNNGSYTSSNPLSMLWPVAYVVIALASVRPATSTVAVETDESVAAMVVPYLPLLGALAVAVPRLLDGRPLGPFLTIDAAVLVALLLLRQALTAWDLRTTVLRLHEQEDELQRLAMEDPLTGLANRARFAAQLEAAVERVGAEPAVVYIDLDRFKEINDRFGHATGDELLVEVAARLRRCLSPTMALARLGGDEFVILVPDGQDEAAAVAGRVLDAFAMPFTADGEDIPFQASIGMASAPPGGSPDEAVRRADAAMYVAKASGRGRAVGYPDDDLVRGA
jgi:diguanylate cyclase (GGDEF)-like protein